MRCACLCDCGTHVSIIRGNLAVTESCGCLKKEQMRLEKGAASRNSILSEYRLSARKKGVIWALSEEHAISLFQSNCEYCGSPPSRVRHRPGAYGGFLFNGIDRQNSSQGYETQNTVPCCFPCNRAKSTLGVTEFLKHVSRIGCAPQQQTVRVAVPIIKMRSRVNTYHHNARYHNHTFNLSDKLAMLLFASLCSYCGKHPSMGIDRINNFVGYEPKNCTPCCGLCNRMKSNRELQEFLSWAESVRQHQRLVRASMM